MAQGRLRILPLGGLGEIGKNMTLVEYDGRIVVIDVGLRFPTAEMHGIDLVLPDFTYLRERAEAIEAVVITHGHEDHLGALPWVLGELPASASFPILGRKLTMAMARSKLDEHRLAEFKTIAMDPGEVRRAGQFEIELVHMTHSIPDAAAVAVKTPLGTVLFTGDYRFDQSPVDGRSADFDRLARFGTDGLLVLCGDSTNADRPGFAQSESVIGPHLRDVFSRCDGRIIVTSFASNIHRVQQVVTAAEALGRHVALTGRSMIKNVKIGRGLGHITFDHSTLIDPRDMDSLADDQLVIVTTGSQGEPLSALRRMAYGEHRQIRLKGGDTVVFSATPVPGNERAINETIDRLFDIGCDVVTAGDAPIHTSGHGHREELKLMLNLTKPKYLMPVHGDFKRIRLHAELAKAVGITEDRIFKGRNGLPLEIGKDGARFGEPEQAGMVFVDGIDIGDPADAVMRDRRALASDGIMFVVATVSEQKGDRVTPPEVIIRGVPIPGDEQQFLKRTREVLESSLDRAADEGLREVGLLEQILHDDLARFVYDDLRRRPMILPVVIEV